MACCSAIACSCSPATAPRLSSSAVPTRWSRDEPHLGTTRSQFNLGELGARERPGDRAVRLAVRRQPDVAAGDLDAVSLLDDPALPSARRRRPCRRWRSAARGRRERRSVGADERATALRAEAEAGTTTTARPSPCGTPRRRPGRRAAASSRTSTGSRPAAGRAIAPAMVSDTVQARELQARELHRGPSASIFTSGPGRSESSPAAC